MEDLLAGVGSVTQTRNGKDVVINKLDIPFAVQSEAEMSALNANLFLRARVYSDTTTFKDYIYDANDNSGIPSDDFPGSWVEVGGSSLSPGDNVSLLTNDAQYTSVGDNVSAFVNDAGYLTTALQAGDNISQLVNDAGYLTTGIQNGDNVSLLTNDANYVSEDDWIEAIAPGEYTTGTFNIPNSLTRDDIKELKLVAGGAGAITTITIDFENSGRDADSNVTFTVSNERSNGQYAELQFTGGGTATTFNLATASYTLYSAYFKFR